MEILFKVRIYFLNFIQKICHSNIKLFTHKTAMKTIIPAFYAWKKYYNKKYIQSYKLKTAIEKKNSKQLKVIYLMLTYKLELLF